MPKAQVSCPDTHKTCELLSYKLRHTVVQPWAWSQTLMSTGAWSDIKQQLFLKTWGIKTLHLLLHSWLLTLYVPEAMLLLQHSGHQPEAYSLVHWPLPSVEEHRRTYGPKSKLQSCLIRTYLNTIEHRLLKLSFSLNVYSIADDPPILLCCWLPMRRCCIMMTHTTRHEAEACMLHVPSVLMWQ